MKRIKLNFKHNKKRKSNAVNAKEKQTRKKGCLRQAEGFMPLQVLVFSDSS